MIKDSLGLSFMIQLKAKAPNNILLIPYLAFIPFVANKNVLSTSLNLNNKNTMFRNFYYTFTFRSKF